MGSYQATGKASAQSDHGNVLSPVRNVHYSGADAGLQSNMTKATHIRYKLILKTIQRVLCTSIPF